MEQTREEHMEWCKQRAREYLNAGDVQQAISSMLSDLSKHVENAKSGEMMASLGLMAAMNNDVEEARKFIEGFN